MKLPFIAIKTASNQQDIYDYIKKEKKLILNRFNGKKLGRLVYKFKVEKNG